MLDNPLNQTQDHINPDQADTLGTTNSVVTEMQKPWSLPILARLAYCYWVLRLLSGVSRG